MKKVFILLLLVITVFSAMAQSVKPTVGILGFTAYNVAESDLLIVEDIFTSELILYNNFKVVNRKTIETNMAESNYQTKSCLYSACAVETGKILGLDYMVYGSVNRLEDGFIISVYLINVKTEQIEGSSREMFYTTDQASDAMPVLIGKLVEGDSYTGASFDPSKLQKVKKIQNEKKHSSSNFIELGAGYVTTLSKYGLEIELSYRYMLGSFFGLSIEGLLAYAYGQESESNNLSYWSTSGGINVYLQVTEFVGVALGFRGFPGYVDYQGAPALALYFGSLYIRYGYIMYSNGGFNADIGYSIRL